MFRALKFSFSVDILGEILFNFVHTDRDISFQEVGSVPVVAPSSDELSRCPCYKTFYISNLQITVSS